MKILIIIVMALIYFPGYAHQKFQTRMSGIGGFVTNIRVGSHAKLRNQKATVIYLHGYSDQMKNHLSLFDQFAQKNLRVVSFDFPEHGGSTGNIWAWSIRDIAELIPRVMAYARVDRRKPIILAGFSAGGTVVTRMLQEWKDILPRTHYDIAGAILISPAIPVNSDAVKANNYLMTRSLITSGTMRYKPFPRSAENSFGNDLQNSARDAYLANLKVRVPVVAFLAGMDRDLYSDMDQAREWVERQKDKGKPVFGYQCHDALHGLEFEPVVGPWVQETIADLAQGMASTTKYRRASAVSSRMSSLTTSTECEQIN